MLTLSNESNLLQRKGGEHWKVILIVHFAVSLFCCALTKSMLLFLVFQLSLLESTGTAIATNQTKIFDCSSSGDTQVFGARGEHF